MSISSEPTMPAYLWTQRPAPGIGWAPPAAPQPWAPAGPSAPWALSPSAVPGWPRPLPPHAARTHRWVPITMATSVAVLAAAAGLVMALAQHSEGAAAHQPVAAAAAPSDAAPSTPAPPPPTPVRDGVLPALLLDTATVNAVMGTTDLAVNADLTSERLYIDTTDHPQCGAVWANANQGAYTGSGWQAVQTRYLREPARPQHEVYESVISFPAADTAKAFVDKESQRWARCRNTAITTTNPGLPPQTWYVTTADRNGDTVTSVADREGAAGYTCQHALTARNNVVVDTVACGRDITGQGVTLAGRIAEQITRTL